MEELNFNDIKIYEFLSSDNEVEKVKRLAELSNIAIEKKQKTLFDNMVRAVKAEIKKNKKQEQEKNEPSSMYECNDKGVPHKIWENLEKLYRKKGIELKYNELKKEIESNEKWYVYDDFITRINSDCKRTKLNLSKDNLWDFTAFIANQSAYNPVATYLEDVHEKYKASDKKESQIEKLLATIKFADFYTKEDMEFNKKILIKWLITGVKMGLNVGLDNAEFNLVFKGEQGLGKTRWIRLLIPKEYLTAFFKDGVQIDLSNKDDIMQATSYWLCELGELGGTMKKSDRDALKAWLTSTHDEYRTPYSRKAEKYPRRTFFACTVNDDEFFRDDTGNRRFVVIEVEALDHKHTIDPDLLWGEVVELYKSGQESHLDNYEIAYNNERNRGYLVKSNEHLLLEEYLPLDQPKEEWGHITNAALCEYMQKEHDIKLMAKPLGQALRAMGFKQHIVRLKDDRVPKRYYKLPYLKKYSIPF